MCFASVAKLEDPRPVHQMVFILGMATCNIPHWQRWYPLNFRFAKFLEGFLLGGFLPVQGYSVVTWVVCCGAGQSK